MLHPFENRHFILYKGVTFQFEKVNKEKIKALTIFMILIFSTNFLGYVWMNWCLIASTIIGIILVIFVKEEYRRTNADTEDMQTNDD